MTIIENMTIQWLHVYWIDIR